MFKRKIAGLLMCVLLVNAFTGCSLKDKLNEANATPDVVEEGNKISTDEPIEVVENVDGQVTVKEDVTAESGDKISTDEPIEVAEVESLDGKNTAELSLYYVGDVQFNMVSVTGGAFMMGADGQLSDQSPIHLVGMDDFKIGETEVTQALWTAVMGSNPSKSNRGDNYPVDNVTWNECHDFVKKLTAIMQANGSIRENEAFHMLTEAQWEYAAKGGQFGKGYRYSGSNKLEEVAWTLSNGGKASHEVAQLKPNELGIYDMSGNVYEWVADYYAPYREPDKDHPERNPCNLSEVDAERHVVKRGGSFWYDDEYRFTSTYRYPYFENVTDESIGLRIALY